MIEREKRQRREVASGKRALVNKRHAAKQRRKEGKERGGVRSGSGGMPSVHSRLHILLSYFSRSIPLSFLSFASFLSSLRKSIFFLLFFLYSYLFPFHSISFSLSIFLLLFAPSFPVALLHTAPPSGQDNLSLSFFALPLSVPSLVYMLASRVPRLSELFFLIFILHASLTVSLILMRFS